MCIRDRGVVATEACWRVVATGCSEAWFTPICSLERGHHRVLTSEAYHRSPSERGRRRNLRS
eukprot:618148-Alexandrium_andersonii.AAC.1